MNIRVDLETTIKDGTEVVFRSPVDCSQITGLIVYFKENGSTASKEFALADAHGNNVGDIDHLFAENVVVKVILDVAHGMAFVQNADTNAYLEGRFNKMIEQLCPTLKETGKLVQCEPVEGYPLTVTTEAASLNVTVCGKNLYNSEDYPLDTRGYVRKDNGGVIEDPGSAYRFTSKYIDISHLRGQYISIRNAPAETNSTSTNAGIAFYYSDKKHIPKDDGGASTNAAHTKVPDKACFMRFSISKDYVNEAQIEIGDSVSDYEPYWERKVTGDGSAVVVAGNGVNTVFGYAGEQPVEITVTGKADPVAIINKLTEAVISLGGNI